jgi:translation initiation factor 2-alpha kinase 4
MHGTEDLDTSPSKDPVNNVRSADGGLTKDVGTALYIAPELDKGSSVSSKFYTSKIDVFSLGIVLFEMFVEPPVTLTERLIILQEFRKSGDYPTNFAHDIPQQHRNASRKLISWMTEHDPAYRPTVDTLLNSDSIPLVELEDDFQVS